MSTRLFISYAHRDGGGLAARLQRDPQAQGFDVRSEEHTSELQSLTNPVCRLLLAKTDLEGAWCGYSCGRRRRRTPRPPAHARPAAVTLAAKPRPRRHDRGSGRPLFRLFLINPAPGKTSPFALPAAFQI